MIRDAIELFAVGGLAAGIWRVAGWGWALTIVSALILASAVVGRVRTKQHAQ